MRTLAAISSGPVALSSLSFFSCLSTSLVRTGRKVSLVVPAPGGSAENSFGDSAGKRDFSMKVSERSVALSREVRAHVPSERFSGCTPWPVVPLPCKEFESFHHCFAELLGSLNFVFVRSTNFECSSHKTCEHSSRAWCSFTVPFAAVLASIAALHRSLSQGCVEM